MKAYNFRITWEKHVFSFSPKNDNRRFCAGGSESVGSLGAPVELFPSIRAGTNARGLMVKKTDFDVVGFYNRKK